MELTADKNEYKIDLYLLLVVPVACVAVGWAILNFPVEKAGIGLAMVSAVTVFLASSLRVQLPGTSIYLTASDAMLFFVLLSFGGEAAILLGVMEALYSSIMIRRNGSRMRGKSIVLNMAVSALSGAASVVALMTFFGRPELIASTDDISRFAVIMIVMAMSQFIVNSILVSVYFSFRSNDSIWTVWNNYCLNALVMYLSGALIGGLFTRALSQVDLFLFFSVALFFAIVYFTYIRYANNLRKTSAKAEQAERERAEQAENHISELEHYIQQLELSSTALRESHEKLHHAAYHDSLTGLPNRNFFLELLKEMIAEAKQTPDYAFSVIYIDLNRFKTINDSLGYTLGDELIKTVSERLRTMAAKECVVGRFGSDEFAIILPKISGTAEVLDLANQLLTQVAQPYDLMGRQVFVNASIGIAIGDRRYEEAGEILRDADIAMYNAKENNKSVVIFDQIMHARAVSLLELETDLRLAVERNEFELYYQPIVSLIDARLTGFEALVRWNHPCRGLVTPGEFIEAAESTGLMVPMTVNILRGACDQLTRWKRARLAPRSLMVSVNLSASHLSQPRIVDQIRDIICETEIDPGCLKLEITESAVMENAEMAIDVLRKIQHLGVQLSIDDFGTGYSSLSYLHRFPIDTLKVDRSFVSAMEEGSENGEIVRTILALAKALRLSVIAEGIESIHQFHQLRVLGCEYGQGYLFSRPIPVGEVERLLEDPGRWSNILPADDIGIIARNFEFSSLRVQ